MRGTGSEPAAAAEQEEEPSTLVNAEGDWATFHLAARNAGKLIDVTLVCGERRVDAHKLVLVSMSPYLDGLLTSGLAESEAHSKELTLEDMDGGAVEAVVDCMYSGKLSLSRATVATTATAGRPAARHASRRQARRSERGRQTPAWLAGRRARGGRMGLRSCGPQFSICLC